ncbi:hypothetical protein M8J77_014120 [Diaphorina citri]|nr:hypothetical protein M8J77_014120 [Diaphorina citri]
MDNLIITNVMTRRVSERIKKERESFLIQVEEYSASDTDSDLDDKIFLSPTRKPKCPVKIKKEDTDVDIFFRSRRQYNNTYNDNLVQISPSDPEIMDTKNVLCYICDEILKDIDDLRYHGLLHATPLGTQFQCNVCFLMLNNRCYTRFHLLKHNWVRFKCDLCSRTFNSQSYLQQHKKHDHEGVKYKCKECGKCYTQNTNLKQHMLSHKGIFFICFHCNKNFTHRALLVRHMQKHSSEQFKCDLCGKVTPYYQHYLRHMRIHQGLEVHECNLCAKLFACKRSLQDHMQRHEEPNKYQCAMCKKQYASKKMLEKHIRRHEGQDYKCYICGNRYATQKYLEEHIRLHQGHTYMCSQCDKTFTHFPNLKRHVKSHDKDRPTFTCDLCNKTCMSKEGFLSHMLGHSDRTITCKLCDAVLMNPACYRSHCKSQGHLMRLENKDAKGRPRSRRLRKRTRTSR